MADDTQTQDAVETTTESKPAITGKYAELIKQIEDMTVLELADFVKDLEDRFGVSASAPMMMAGPAVGTADAAPVEEKTSFNVVLTAAGDQKIAVIKAL